MTLKLFVWQVIISLFILLVWEVLGPLRERVSARLKRPSPLTPQYKGQLVQLIAAQQLLLERFTHFSEHPKDLFLYLYQLAAVSFLSFVVAVSVYFYAHYLYLPVSICFMFISICIAFAGILEARRMSDKNMETTKAGIQKSIDDAKKRLEPS